MVITKATVLVGQGPDRVFLTTDQPNPFIVYNDPLSLTFEATANTGAKYVKDNFGIDAEIINRG